MKVSPTGDISDQVSIFFEFSEGLVYESTGRDDLAFIKYVAKKYYLLIVEL